MYDFILEIGHAIMRNGLSLSALGTALFVLLKQRKVKRIIRKRLPWLLRDDADVMNYEARQIRIESKLDALMNAGGIQWDADSLNGKTAHKSTNGAQKKSLLPQVAYALVTIARYFTQLKETYHLSQRRMNMKSKLLSRKFILALATGVLVILNDGLDLGLKTDTIMYVVGIVATWIVGESAVDISNKPKVNEIEKSYHGE